MERSRRRSGADAVSLLPSTPSTRRGTHLPRRERAIADALKEKLRQRALDREERARAWRKEMEAFTAEFMAAAQKVFEMIDKDGSGSLAIDEITRAVKEEQEVIDFLENCGEPNLQFLLRPKRLKKALEALDTDKSGEVDEEEWCVTRRPFRHRRNAHRSPRAGTRRSTGASLLD